MSKFLSYEDRMIIAQRLQENASFGAIGKELGKDRPRYKKPEFKVDRGCRIERSYADFQKYLGANPETTIVQMDSVICRVGGKCLLTIHFVESSLMLAFLRDANTSASSGLHHHVFFIRLIFRVFFNASDCTFHNFLKFFI